MNKNFIIILFFAMIIVGVVIYTNSKHEKDSEDDKPETLAFEVVGVTVSKTENYKPWFTERYTADEYVAMSQGAKFTYKFRINGGVDLLQNLSITRKRADGGSDQIEEVPESDWVKARDIDVDFSVQAGENAKGEHEFSINYTTPDDNVTRNRPHTINITENLLSVKLESGGSEELEMVPVETGDINVAFSAEREEIYIYDSEKVVNFNAEGSVYMSPVEGTNGKGFKLEGDTGQLLPDTLYRVKYRGGYLLALSENANFTDTEYLSTDKSKKKFTDGEVNNKLFYITADANSATAADNFFLDLAENVGSSAPAPEACSGPLTIGDTISNGSWLTQRKYLLVMGGYIFGVKAKTDIRIKCISCLSKHTDPDGQTKETDDGRVAMYRLKPGRSRLRSWCSDSFWSCRNDPNAKPTNNTINSNEEDWTFIGEALPSGGNWSDTTLSVSEDVSAGETAYFYINSMMEDGYMTAKFKSNYDRGAVYSDEQCELGWGFGVYGGSESEGNLGKPFLEKYENFWFDPEWLRISYQKMS
tara:strand:- start:261 stop:1853 length:1593 start_codon:yes stop_codon:yes gene_type:complete